MQKLNHPTLLRDQCLIGGQWLDADDGRTMDVCNPANGEPVGRVPYMSTAETRRAIEAAQAALPAWRDLLARERAAILRRWYELLLRHQEDLALIMTLEQGKPMTESRGEIGYAASFLEWFAEEGKRIYGDSIPSNQHGKRILVLKQPVGVCAAITPWNFPAAMITRKAGAALAAGCTMVVKPASQTPLSALALGVLAEEAGVPAGVLSIVTGDTSAIGAELTGNPVVRKLTFTGSTEVGRELLKASADTIKKVTMELGGNAPFIVFDDADVDAAVEGAMASKYRNSGQTCVCANRFYAQDGIYDRFVEQLAKSSRALKVGDGADDDVNQGPLIDDRAREKVEAHIADAVEGGARVVTGGSAHELGGNFFQPTVLADVTTGMRISREETFGPVAAVFRFGSEAEVIERANDTEFGLAAYFYARDLGRVWRVAEALEYGMVGINTGMMSSEVAPFGGIKSSGIGREGSYYGIEEYVEPKYLCIDGIDA